MRRDSSVLGPTSSITGILFATLFLPQTGQIASANDLEPCINGAVSSTGVYASQANQDQSMRSKLITITLTTHPLDLEPCINGKVSESGLYASQEVGAMMTTDRYADMGELGG